MAATVEILMRRLASNLSQVNVHGQEENASAPATGTLNELHRNALACTERIVSYLLSLIMTDDGGAWLNVNGLARLPQACAPYGYS